MKTPRSLSYSSLSLFEKDIEEFYMRYLADKAAPRLPQEPPMAVGSAFDAFVKAALHSQLFGVSSNPQFEFGAIFESQVEPQCRDFALKAGKHIWKCYKLTGAYEELFVLLQRSIEPPRFEFKVEGLIGGAPSWASRTAASCSTWATDRSTSSSTGKSTATAPSMGRARPRAICSAAMATCPTSRAAAIARSTPTSWA